MPRHYQEPPVVEALAEVYFDGSEWDLATPGLFYERIRDSFPVRGQIAQLDVTVEVGPGSGRARMAPSEPRARFAAEDGSRIVQVGKNVLVVNQLRPYPGFDVWKPTVAEMLDIYLDLASPTGYQRLGLRYINKVTMPTAQRIELEDYFRLYPEAPEELGSPFGRFIMRIESRPPAHPDHTLVTTFGSSETDDRQPAVLLDLYDNLDADPSAALDQVPTFLDDAHDNVEAAFESSITDRSRELFEEVRHAQSAG